MAVKTFKWSAPTERVDGTPLDLTEIGGYRLYVDGTAVVDMPGSLNPDGQYEFQRDFAHGKYVAEITCIDTGGRESGKSNSVPFEVISLPAAPVLLGVS